MLGGHRHRLGVADEGRYGEAGSTERFGVSLKAVAIAFEVSRIPAHEAGRGALSNVH
jgi:hypothetical protein